MILRSRERRNSADGAGSNEACQQKGRAGCAGCGRGVNAAGPCAGDTGNRRTGHATDFARREGDAERTVSPLHPDPGAGGRAVGPSKRGSGQHIPQGHCHEAWEPKAASVKTALFLGRISFLRERSSPPIIVAFRWAPYLGGDTHDPAPACCALCAVFNGQAA